ncbi:MAG: MipA/OmpV family protein [Methylobacteriaceae bacterium]|nr:MipA/OmpV family protein [Methylobacteriaceae bacterium]
MQHDPSWRLQEEPLPPRPGARPVLNWASAVLAAVLMIATRGPTAYAADLPFGFLAPPPGWVITLGTQVQGAPKFAGSDKYEFTAIPTLTVRRPGEPDGFTTPDDSIEYTVFGNERFRIGPVASFDPGRYLSDDHRLIGLHSVSWGVEAGVFGELWPIVDKLRTRVEVRYGYNYGGFIADVGGDWVEKVGRFTLSAGPRIELADTEYMRKYFGVTPAEAAANGVLTPFSPTGGLRSVGVTLVASYQITEAVKATAFARYDRLVLDAAKSPIVTKFGSPDQVAFGFGLSYAFWSSL